MHHHTDSPSIIGYRSDGSPIMGIGGGSEQPGELPGEISELLARVADLEDAELASLESALIALAGSTDDLDALEVIAGEGGAVDQVRSELVRRETEQLEAEERRSALLSRLQPPEDEEEAEEAEEAEEVEEEAEVEQQEEEEAGAEEPVEQARAAAAPPLRRPRRTFRAPASHQPRQEPQGAALIAAANVPNVPHGQRITTLGALQEMTLDFVKSRRTPGASGEWPIAQLRASWPENRILGGDTEVNMARIHSITNPDALVAAGGICAPAQVVYDLPVIGAVDRPVRDALARFGATRGGVRLVPLPSLGDVESGVGVWTGDTDAEPGTEVKPCIRVECDEEYVVQVDAVTACIEVGNFQRLFYPEQFQAWLRLLQVAHARVADSRLLDTIGNHTQTLAVAGGQVLGVTRDIVDHYARLAATFRSRERVPDTTPFQVLIPRWLQQMMRIDLMRQIPGDDKLNVADAEIRALFTAHAITPSFYWDTEAGAAQILPAQGAGAINEWPTVAVGYLFAPGTWLHLDGGRLDFGTEIRDSGLIQTNDVRGFFETFEGAAFNGHRSFRVESTICATGATSGTVAVDCGP